MQIIVFTSCLLLLIAIGLSQVDAVSKFKNRNKKYRFLKFRNNEQPQIKYPPTAQWFNQSLDHFDHTNKNIWQQVSYYILFNLIISSKIFTLHLSAIFITHHFLMVLGLSFYTLLVNGTLVQMMLFMALW